MTTADHKLIDKSLTEYGDDFWTDESRDEAAGKDWVIDELLEILAKDNLDLKVIRKRD